MTPSNDTAEVVLDLFVAVASHRAIRIDDHQLLTK